MRYMKLRNRALLSFLLLSVAIFLIISLFIHQWSHQEEGVLPAKTAVILHAINNRLITLDMRPPRFLTARGDATFTIENHFLSVSDGKRIPIRIYKPMGEGPFPTLLYFHGGAFLEGFGNIDTHDNIARYLTLQSNSIVITVGYRLAPSYMFPTAIEDSYEALLWAEQNISTWNGDPSRIAVAGDSAGGNIATVVSLMARDRAGPDLKGQILIYPLTTFQELSLESRDRFSNGYYLLSESVMAYAREAYAPEDWMWYSSYTSPLHAEDLSQLPPSLIITAEFDPLRDEAELYAKRLHDEGVPVQVYRFEGVMHAFISFYEIMQRGQYGLQLAASFLEDVYDAPQVTEVYPLQKISHLSRLEQSRDTLEAYLFAGYLLWRKGVSLLKY